MAFPVVEAVSSWAGAASNTTSHGPITLPDGVVAGDILVCLFAVDGGPTCNASTGWEKLYQARYLPTVTSAVFWKVATGSDELTVTTTISEMATAIVYRISSGSGLVGASASGSGVDADPPALTPAGGAGDYLWIAGHCSDSTVVASAAPPGYGSLTTQTAASTYGASISAAIKSATASSEDPGPFTSADEQWVTWTIAVTGQSAPTPNQVRTSDTGPLGQSSAHLERGEAAQIAQATASSPGPLGTSIARVTSRRYFVSGTVTDINGAPCERVVCLLNRDLLGRIQVIAQSVSDPVTGEYLIETDSAAEVSRIVFDSDDEPLLPDLISRVIPG